MKEMWKWSRVCDRAMQRWLYVAIFVINAVVVVGATITLQWWFLTPFNLAIAVFYGWLSWPTLTGTTATERAKDATSNT